jgi:5-methyltetrahydrofolate--homocysteine methyltransferase
MSAEAAKAAFNALKEAMKETPREKKGRLILATVHGDVHDIGKNIVKVLLENYGYDVIDLGKDVPPETVVKTALQEKVPLGRAQCPDDNDRLLDGKKRYGSSGSMPPL